MTVGLGLCAGCLQLQETSDNGTETADDARGDEERTDEDPPEIPDELTVTEAWTHEGLQDVTTLEGSFVSVVGSADSNSISTARVELFEDDGTVAWHSAELAAEDRLTFDQSGGIVGGDDTIIIAATAPGLARLYAFDRESGTELWTHQTEDGRSDPAVGALLAHDGTVYYGVADGGSNRDDTATVRALQADSGDVLWENQFAEWLFSGATVYDDRLYVGGGWDLYTFDPESGTRRDSVEFSIGHDGFARENETLYFGLNPIQAYDLATESEQWERDAGREHGDGMAVADGTLYRGTRSGWVIARDGSDGETQWETRINGYVRDLQVADGIVWAQDDSNDVVAIGSDTGEIIYEHDETVSQFAASGKRVMLNDTMYERSTQ